MLCHVATVAEWAEARARGDCAPAALARDGFLHCCTEAQLGFVLARHFAGRPGLVLLRFDPARTGADLRWDRSEPDQDPFPHLYGALPLGTIEAADPVTSPSPPPVRG